MPDRHTSTTRQAPPAAQSSMVEALSGERVSVLLPLPLTGAFDYLAPPGLSLVPGAVVRVPFGNRQLIGVVWDRAPGADAGAAEPPAKPPIERLKLVLAQYDVPPLTAVARKFIAWVSGYTMAPLGAVLKMALSVPDALSPPKPVTGYRLAPNPEALDIKMTPARRRVLAEAEDCPALTLADLTRAAGVSGSVVTGLVKAGVLEGLALPPPPAFAVPDAGHPGPKLSADQANAASNLAGLARDGGFTVTLLDGVTGSGKTEVYFEALAAALATGRQVLVLLPEIALSSQWLERFVARFGVKPAAWHSDLTPVQRRTTWRAVAYGDARVVVGARSALFLPFQDLGLIVVDEEHEAAFKQEDGVIYHARDMAVVRAHLGEIPIVLVSATPSLETVTNVDAGRYRCLHLPDRHGGAALPAIDLIDLREDRPPRLEGLGQSWLSPTLRQAVTDTLAAGEQAMLFLNRRGYAPLTLCRACGHRLKCPNCTAWLVEHRRPPELQCHHCGYAIALPLGCPACGAKGALAACGPGVERLAEEVSLLFPNARTAIMASDTVTGPAVATTLLQAIEKRDVDLIIGTQIVAKGHHFPFLTLVGVVDADLGLFGGDLRAAERTYQMLHQVAGRAGRAQHAGRVLLQTVEPGHAVMQALVSGDRDRFLQVEADSRQRAGMPPFGRLAALIIASPDRDTLDDFTAKLARAAPQRDGVAILGPAPAPLSILRGRHRSRFLIKTRRDIAPQAVLKDWLGGVKKSRNLQLQIDIDPYNFL